MTTVHAESIESHHNPSFLTDGGIDLTSTALYLPPLLSSLPYSCLETHNEPSRNIPPSCMFTEARLPDIDSASLSLHKALHRFRPVTPDYATTPYVQAFNWDELHLPIDEEHEWYCVSFRSTRKLESHGEALYEADRLAHEEAVQNGGLLLYWYGPVNPKTRANLATCIWHSREHAIAASSRPKHIRAARLAASTYETYELERWVLRKEKGSTGITVERWRPAPL